MGRLKEGISRLFGGGQPDEVRGPPAPRAAAPSAPAAPPAGARKQGSDARLRSLLSQKDLISAGRLQVLGLDKIRERLGSRWEVLAERVDVVVQTIIKRRLAPSDVFMRFGDATQPAYIILFAELAKEEAQIKCALIAEEVASQLLGDDDAGGCVDVKTLVTAVDGSLAAESVDPIEIINRLLDKEAEKLEASETPPGGGPKPGAGPKSQAPANTVKFAYQPVWDVRKNAILTFRCVPLHDEISVKPVNGDPAMATGVVLPPPALEQDVMILRRAIWTHQQLQQQGKRLLLACCVHFETLTNGKSRTAYFQLLRTAPESLRGDMVFEIVGLPKGVPLNRLSEIVSTVRPWCRASHLQVGLDDTQFKAYRDAGFATIGADVTTNPAAEATLIKAMNLFVEKADNAGFRTFIRGLKTKSLTMAAVGAGFDYIDGEAVFAAIDTLGQAYKFNPKDLFSHLLKPTA